jgi:hypothetical protein
MTTEATIGTEIRSISNDACLDALESNWVGILAGAAGEIIQWSWDELTNWIDPFNYLAGGLMFLPFIGGYLQDTIVKNLITPFDIDWTTLYAYGVIGDIFMARNNANCTANIYFETKEILKVDRVFASDADYYLNGIQASQEFYLALYNLHVEGLKTIPIFRWFIGIPLEIVRWFALIGFPIITIMLQVDTESLQPVANVVDQLTAEKAANGGKLAP